MQEDMEARIKKLIESTGRNPEKYRKHYSQFEDSIKIADRVNLNPEHLKDVVIEICKEKDKDIMESDLNKVFEIIGCPREKYRKFDLLLIKAYIERTHKEGKKLEDLREDLRHAFKYICEADNLEWSDQIKPNS